MGGQWGSGYWSSISWKPRIFIGFWSEFLSLVTNLSAIFSFCKSDQCLFCLKKMTVNSIKKDQSLQRKPRNANSNDFRTRHLTTIWVRWLEVCFSRYSTWEFPWTQENSYLRVCGSNPQKITFHLQIFVTHRNYDFLKEGLSDYKIIHTHCRNF